MVRQEVVPLAIAFTTVIAIPWVLFVTLNIFALKQQVALLRAELDLLQEIRAMLKTMLERA